jgi:hypothetical protein
MLLCPEWQWCIEHELVWHRRRPHLCQTHSVVPHAAFRCQGHTENPVRQEKLHPLRHIRIEALRREFSNVASIQKVAATYLGVDTCVCVLPSPLESGHSKRVRAEAHATGRKRAAQADRVASPFGMLGHDLGLRGHICRR